MEIAPYLNFDGSCREAFEFYADVLGGTVTFLQTFGDSPMEAPPGWKDKVMHATLTIGTQRLMGSDAPPKHYQRAQGTYVSLHPKRLADGERVFAALADRGTVEMPFGKTFWSQGFGSVVDRFGTRWMVNVEEPSA